MERQSASTRIGLVATDPLRVLGLKTILTEWAGERQAEVVELSGPGALKGAELSLAVIDASCTEHLFELLASFRRSRPRLKVIVVGLKSEPEFIEQVIGLGAKGYLTHSATETEIRMALNVVTDGSVWAPRKVMARLLEGSARREMESAVREPNITERELEVLKLLATGQTNRGIATALGIDEGTVKAHIGRLMRKVGVENRTALTVQAVRLKLTA